MASSTGARHRRARKLATLVTVVACFAPVPAQAAVLDPGTTVPLPTINAGDVQILGPSTVRVQQHRRHRKPRHHRVPALRRGLAAQPAHGEHHARREPAADQGRPGPARPEAGQQLQRPAGHRDAAGDRRQQHHPVHPSRGGVRQPGDRRSGRQHRKKRTRCTIVGTAKADKLVGTKKADVICGLGGNDRIIGRRRQRPDPRRQGQRPRLRWSGQRPHPRQQRPRPPVRQRRAGPLLRQRWREGHRGEAQPRRRQRRLRP